VFSRVYIAEEADGVGDKGSGDTTTVDVQTLEDLLKMSLRSACFIDSIPPPPSKRQNIQFWDYSPQVPECQDFLNNCHCFKGILPYYKKYERNCGNP